MAWTSEGARKRDKKLRDELGSEFFTERARAAGKAPYKGKKGYAANPDLAKRSARKKLSKKPTREELSIL